MEKAGLVRARGPTRRTSGSRASYLTDAGRASEARAARGGGRYVNATFGALPEATAASSHGCSRSSARIAEVGRRALRDGGLRRGGRAGDQASAHRLRPYRWISPRSSLFLLLVQAIANLYLPTLNADIINNGVVTGDTAYILQDRRASCWASR